MNLTYKYGADSPVSGLAELRAEHERMTGLWNKLVDIDREHEAMVLRAACSDPIVLSAHLAMCLAQLAVGTSIRARREARAQARAKLPTPELDQVITEAVRERTVTRAAWWSALSAWRKSHADIYTDLLSHRKDAVKLARQGSGCYWGNYNAVLQAYETARQLCRKTGRSLRHRDPARTDGRIVVQIQRTASGLGAANTELHDGSVSGIQIKAVSRQPSAFRGDRDRSSRTHVTMRCDAHNNHIIAPLYFHRDLPSDARIKSVAYVWTPGPQSIMRYSLCLSIDATDPPLNTATSAAGIDVGWRLQSDGRLRVATLANSHNAIEYLCLSARWLRRMQYCDDLQAHADTLLADFAAHLLATPDLPDNLLSCLGRWNPTRSVSYIDESALDVILLQLQRAGTYTWQSWRTTWRRTRLEAAHLRDKLLRERRDIYRVWCSTIAQRYGILGIEDLDLAQMARTKKREDGSDPELHAAARANRQRACIHELLGEIAHQARKRGAKIASAIGASTLICHSCKERQQPIDRSALHWSCHSCGNVEDQDINAARNLLAFAVGEASALIASTSRTPTRITKFKRLRALVSSATSSIASASNTSRALGMIPRHGED